MKIVFCGGGTMGPVTPLIAVYRQMKKRRSDLQAVWAGTPNGPEKEVIQKEGIAFREIPVAKFPRYVSAEWMTWPWQYLRAREVSYAFIREVKPDLVCAAGGFTQTPVMRAARRSGIPCVIHQLDAEPGLSNRLVARWAKLVTTSFSYQTSPFYGTQIKTVPTPSRFSGIALPARDEAVRSFDLDPAKPVVFVVGGGTGALAINEAIAKDLEKLLQNAQVIHLTGKGKLHGAEPRQGYVVSEFYTEEQMEFAYAAADLVISRAGMGGLSDLACLSKPAIIIPIPESHQEKNAERLPYPVLTQNEYLPEKLLEILPRTLEDAEHRAWLGEEAHRALPTDDGSVLAEMWLGIVNTRNI